MIMSKDPPQRSDPALKPCMEANSGESTIGDNQPPNHGKVTNSMGARFLEEIDPETLGENWIEELAARFQTWKEPNHTVDEWEGER